jgi:hypothetical protein
MSIVARWSSFRHWMKERDEKRGFRVDYKRATMAYAIEIIVIVASLIGAYYFANKYGRGDWNEMKVMMLAPLGYAIIEFCRVPLAISTRTQRNWLIKLAALIGVICAAFVTIKSMSQLGYLMFQPRLEEVSKAQRNLAKVEADLSGFEQRYQNAKAVFDQRKQVLDTAETRVLEANNDLAALPPAQRLTQRTRLRDGRVITTVRLVPDTRIDALRTAGIRAQADRSAASAEFDVAQRELRALDRSALDNAVAAAREAKKEALFDSQLHTFTAMVFGKDPDQVSEDELHWFLRLFVFIPAICVSFASTLLAFTAVERLKRRPEFADDAGSFLLGPMATAMIDEANRIIEKTAQDVMRGAKAAAEKGAGEARRPTLAAAE